MGQGNTNETADWLEETLATRKKALAHNLFKMFADAWTNGRLSYVSSELENWRNRKDPFKRPPEQKALKLM